MSETTKSYKDTLNLPQTDFPMKASLVQREPERLAKWKEIDLYKKVQEAHAGDEPFVLHDGPPFANGDIHLGHVINKVLKDVVLRYQTMRGHATPYVPGWDCHGLPIEHQVQTKLGPKLREMDTLAVRKLCHEHAEKFIGRQSEQFQRLGILGDWDRPYKTMDPHYEAATLDVFARMVEHGLVYKKLKPVHWSITNRTALADAELEYQDRDDPSVWVEFAAQNPGEFKSRFDVREQGKVNFLIWTTTPWTLPANLAIAVGPEVDYDFVAYEKDGDKRIDVVASKLRERTFALRGVDGRVLKTVRGEELDDIKYVHPFVENRVGRVVLADYVTTEDGTGLVHTAPGHGEEDFETGLKYGLEVYSPVDPAGRFDSTTPNFVTGLTVWEGNPVIVEKLDELGVLFHTRPIHHSYPHDWRSKTPTIFRATEQWFVSLDTPFAVDGGDEKSLRDRAIEVANTAAFHPAWGRQRLLGMLQNRPDWCVSRQRAWGLPIPVFYNEENEPLLTPASVRAVAATFEKHGSDAWFRLTPAELLGDFDAGAKFPVDKLRKESDIFDVWLESGSSWHGVLDARDDMPDAPADLYLEGSDQHRGWFQLSLLAALGATGSAPFKGVLTHGFIVKPDGTKVSKSDKEYVTATQEIDRHGADLLRLWTCSVDYTGDVKASPEILAKFGDDYRKIRNTLRFLLGNISDFDPSQPVDVPADSLDGWMLAELDSLIHDVRAAFDGFLTHHAYRRLHGFCNEQVSAVYGNAMKDRLYCDAADALARRRSQFVQWKVADALVRLLAPMLVFTADEAWEFLPGERVENVHLAKLPEDAGVPRSPAWPLLMRLRDDALLQLDALKREKGLNKATDAEIVYKLTADDRRRLEPFGVDLADVVGAGSYTVQDAEKSAVRVLDRRDDYALCARSRKRTPDVGSDPEYPDLSARDAAVMRSLS